MHPQPLKVEQNITTARPPRKLYGDRVSLNPGANHTTLSVTHRNLIAKAAVEHAVFYRNGTLHFLKNLLRMTKTPCLL